MYKCKDCEKEFRFAKRATERHGISGERQERIWLCPYCESHHFEKLPEHYCKNCGIKLNDARDYCSAACRKKGEAAYMREAERRRQLNHDPLILAIREVEAYNKLTGKRLTYGEYFGGKR